MPRRIGRLLKTMFFGSQFAEQGCAAIFNGAKPLKVKGAGDRAFPAPR